MASAVQPPASLSALRATHKRLMAQRTQALGQPGDAPITAVLDQVATFLETICAAGALIEDDADREAAQGMLSYWANLLYRAGRQATARTLAEFDPELAPQLPDSACPYLGLDAFSERDAERFFGRRRVVEQLATLIGERRLVAVVGPSGSGKSSVVRAGLLPALQLGWLSESQSWRYLPVVVPGAHPLAQLAAAQDRQPEPGQATLLTIDQFEETFTLCTDEAERAEFLAALVARATDKLTPHRVVLTMRSDFESFVARAETLQQLFENGKVSLPPMSASELRAAIELPAEQAGLRFEPGVVDALLQDIVGEPAALPLLQFTLLKLWERRERNRVTQAAYQAVGGGRLALARAADDLYSKLIPQNQITARRILLRLVRPGEGLEVTSNRILRADLMTIGEDPGRVERVLRHLVDARLLRLTPGKAQADDQVEVAHEALVRNWPTLVEWLEDERAALRQRQRLTAAAEQWERLGRDPGALLRGALLEEARRYDDLSHLEQEFVRAGADEQERVEREREANRQRELEQARALAAEQTHSARRLRCFSLILAAVLLVALIAAGVALNQSMVASIAATASDQSRASAQAAKDEALTAESKALTSEAEAQYQRDTAQVLGETAEATARVSELQRLAVSARTLLDFDPELSRLLMIEAAQRMVDYRISDSQVLTAIDEAVRTPFVAKVLGGHSGAVRRAIWNPEYALIATISDDLMVRVWQEGNDTPITLAGHTDIIASVNWSPDGTRLLTASSDGSARVWDIVTHQGVDLNPKSTRLNKNLQLDFMRDAVWSPDGRYIATANNDKTAVLWDAETYKKILVFQEHDPQRGFINKILFSPDSRCVLTVSDDATARVWSVTSDHSVDVLMGHAPNDTLTWADWSSDSRQVVTASSDRSARIWRSSDPAGSPDNGQCQWSRPPDQPTILGGPSGHQTEISIAIWSPDGKYVATGAGRAKPAYTPDAIIRIWDASSGEVLRLLKGHSAPITSLVFSASGQRLLSASEDGTARVWEVSTGEQLMVLRGHLAAVRSAEWNNDESLILTASDDTTARLWAQDQEETAQLGIDTLINRAECQVNRGLTDEEIARFSVPTPLKFDFASRQCPPALPWEHSDR